MGLLSPTDIATVSALLDEALELPAAEREAWLAALPAEHQRHATALRAMLAERDSTRGGAFLASGPQLAGGVADEAVAKPGELVGAYRLLREIGRGGMGSVWLAERADGAFERQVALKLPRLTWAEGLAERMARERRIGALLEHPNIARLYDAGLDEHGRPFLALEYIEGQPIDAWCREQRLDVKARLRLFVQVVRAVAYAHGRLVVHRDLKPSNVLVTADGQAHLLDFGIAKLLQQDHSPALTQEQGRVMTPQYASPEQIAGEPVTVQSDVYSLGVLLYELLTGVLPYEGRRHTMGALEEAILQGDAPPASSRAHDKALARQLRGELDAIVGKAMQRELPRRYATADALADDIERYVKGETVAARPDSVAYRWAKFVRRNWLGVTACAAVLVAIVAGSGVAVVQAHRAERAAERASIVKAFVLEVFNINSGASDHRELRKMPAETLVEHGAKLIEARFPGQPQLQAELHGVVARIFVDMGAPELAVEHATKLVATLTAAGAGNEDQAHGSLLLARALFEHKRFADAAIHAAHAADRAAVDTEVHLEARVLLATAYQKMGQSQRSEQVLAAVEDALKRHQGSALLTRAKATSLRSATLLGTDLEQALSLRRKAIEQALAAEGPLSDAAAAMRLQAAYWLIVRNRREDAQQMMSGALAALRSKGGPAELRAALEESRLVRQMVIMGSLPYAEAKRLIERNLEFVDSQWAKVPRGIRARISHELGVVEYSWGNVDAGLRLMEAASADFVPAPEDVNERWAIATMMGAAAMKAGQHERADRLLRQRLALRQQMGQGSFPFAAYDHAYVALNLGMQGLYEQAFAVVAESPQFGRSVPGDPDSDYSQVLPATRTRLLLDSGRFAEALASAPPTATGAIQSGPSIETIGDPQIQGESLCGVHRHEDGLRWLKVEIEQRERVMSPNEPVLARTRAVAGLCAVGARRLADAREFASQARAAFVAQPNVSPYYKAPLIQLERRLGLKLPSP